ncbi:MAG: hypothetical protein WCT11_00950 [Candidatus Magasanikbacteria bacterium]
MTLSPKSNKILEEYFNLPFDNVTGIRCPYFNNARRRQRAQLRVLVGKGTPKEILEEAKIISIQYHAGLFDKTGHCCLHNEHTGEKSNADEVRKFLIDNNLGVECSGFVTQILRAHFKETKGVDLVRKFFIVSPKNFIRWIIAKLRPIENIGVTTYADEKNTNPISWQESQVGDVIVFLETKAKYQRNHIMLITDKTNEVIRYAHARAWNSEGKYGHGVSKGEIKIVNLQGDLLKQEWTEQGKTNEQNETFLEAKSAQVLEVRRIIL